MDPATRALIEALHRDSPYKYALALTGGGTGAVAALLSVPGGSRTLLGATVPYSEQALTEFLGRAPQQFCSADTTLALARRALERARQLAPAEAVAGVGCTASLATDRPKRGDHRFHLAVVRSDGGGEAFSVVLQKGARDRPHEEAVLDAVLLNALAEVFGVVLRVDPGLLPSEEIRRHPLSRAPLALLVAGAPDAPAAVCVEADGRHRLDGPRPPALLPGAFNPLHHAHRALAAEAARRLGCPVAFEMSAVNVDKGALPVEEVRRRITQFAWEAPLWVTRAPTFAAKAALFPGAVFVVGADTAARILEPRYYPQGHAGALAALGFLSEQGCRFLVACRLEASGKCFSLDDLQVPEAGRDLFLAIPRDEFRIDISSTELRGQTPPNPRSDDAP
jgi:hypothetical protein